jgi:EAL domain-containing protein (putative c-di-GMP-specific phosphodiesterase class I)
LNIDVLAEYVSSEEIRDKLKENGCYMYQGWYYSPAVEYDAFVEMLKDNESNG